MDLAAIKKLQAIKTEIFFFYHIGTLQQNNFCKIVIETHCLDNDSFFPKKCFYASFLLLFTTKDIPICYYKTTSISIGTDNDAAPRLAFLLFGSLFHLRKGRIYEIYFRG